MARQNCPDSTRELGPSPPHLHPAGQTLRHLRWRHVGNPPPPPPGFVEPNPSFWREYTRLVERTSTILNDHGVFKPSPLANAARLRDTARSLEKRGYHLATSARASMQSARDEFDYWPVRHLVLSLGNNTLLKKTNHTSDEEMRADFRQAIDFLNTSAAQIERGEKPATYLSAESEIPLADRWHALATLARQLETILVKQLYEAELNDSDCIVLIQFGQKLAHTMGYFSSAYHEPRDDAPAGPKSRTTPTKTNPSASASAARNRSISSTPWQGEELLCIGAVLPYFEEWAPTKRLTDDEWKQKPDSPSAPRPPAWIETLIAR